MLLNWVWVCYYNQLHTETYLTSVNYSSDRGNDNWLIKYEKPGERKEEGAGQGVRSCWWSSCWNSTVNYVYFKNNKQVFC